MSESTTNLWSIALLVIVPLLTAILTNFLFNRKRAIRYVSVAAAVSLLVITLVSTYGYQWFTGMPAVDTSTFTFTFDASLPAWRLALEYYFGPLQQILIAVMALILVLVVLVASPNLTKNQGAYIGMIFLTFMSAAIIIMVNDLYHLWIGVEIGSLVVAGVVVASGEGISHRAALKYTFFSALSGAGLAVALALILGLTGYSNISDAIRYIQGHDLGGMTSVLYVAFGFFTLAWIYAGGLAPVHPLKSDVYGAAFPHGTAMLQAQSKLMLVAMGIVMLRLFGVLPFTREVMIVVSVLTMMFGVVMALLQTDFRWILAYLIVSHSGLVTIGISLGTTEGVTGGLFQAVNDIVYMSVLLIVAEAVIYFGRGTSTKTAIGIAKKAPWLTAAVVLGAMAASGIPLFNGFQSEIILIRSLLLVNLPEIAAVILFVSVTTFIAIFRGIYTLFFKPADPLLNDDGSAVQVKETPVPRWIYIALGILIVITLVIGVYPDLVLNFVTPIAQMVSIPWYP
jgi:energy-converting hydrogenase B subunit F